MGRLLRNGFNSKIVQIISAMALTTLRQNVASSSKRIHSDAIVKALRGALISMALLVAVFAAVLLLPQRWREHQLIRQSKSIMGAVERYHQHHGLYPASLAEAGITEIMEGPIYYQRESESSYRLWFGTHLGESRTFDSTERFWR
jgi:hypothetical protein